MDMRATTVSATKGPMWAVWRAAVDPRARVAANAAAESAMVAPDSSADKEGVPIDSAASRFERPTQCTGEHIFRGRRAYCG